MTDRWIEKDLRHIWHPYTQVKDSGAEPPILIDRAEGIRLFDRDGGFYYDTISSWWCNVHGHNHPRVKEAIKRQVDSLEHVLFAGFTHKPAIELAERLISIAPRGLERVFYSDNGSTAVEAALKISFQYWRNTGKTEKRRFLSLDYGYHGDTIGTMSISGVDLFNEIFSPLFYDSFKAPSPYCYRCPMGKEREGCAIDCLRPMEDILKREGRRISGIIMEPMLMGAGGMIVYPEEYLKGAADLAKKYDVHLILDEVATGFGRTGKMFACEHAGVAPDIMCLSKGITSGSLPMAATLVTGGIFDAFRGDDKRKTFYHGHTYTANPIACAAACASLDIFKDDNVLDKVNKLIPLLRDGMERFGSLDIAGDVRHIGMIGAVELVKEGMGPSIYREGLKNNILLRPLGDVIYLFLPLCVTGDQIEEITEKAYGVIEAVTPAGIKT
jgi:adenosylmethionine-8-amino-7-oxononanoate aminotransferase